jgi:regulator of sirC expression with transglutaminase-like and TPR domain
LSSRSEARSVLMRLAVAADDASVDLGEAALALAAFERPDRAMAPYRAHLDDLATEVGAACADSDGGTAAQVNALRAVIVERYGYAGDDETYDDVRNANLMWVIDRRRGLPVSLGILYLHCARRLGWDMIGLNFPGHFLLRLEHEGVRVILDPFSGGALLNAADMRGMLKAAAGNAAEMRPDYYQPVSARDVLLRLMNNIKLRHVASDDVPRALGVLERMRLFAPDEPSIWRETGLLEAHLGNRAAAVEALETFISLSDNDRLRRHAAVLIQELKGKPW